MSGRVLVAIHQPNFFPWLGYFDKMARADVFVFMDNAQFPKKGGTWCNRVQLLVNGEPSWMTAPVDRTYHGVKKIQDMTFSNALSWRTKFVKTLELHYRKAPFYVEVFPLVRDLILSPNDHVAAYNMAVVRSLARIAKMDPPEFVLGSTLDARGEATDLLISMVKAVGGTAYLCGGGAQGYQEDELFAKANLDLIYQNFTHPKYSQSGAGEFVPGLSIIDALMHCGRDGTRALLARP